MSTIVPMIEPVVHADDIGRAVRSSRPEILTEIYSVQNNITIWERDLPEELKKSINYIIGSKSTLQIRKRVTPQNTDAILEDALNADDLTKPLREDITQLVDMFCCLFDLKHAGLRLTTLDRAMCPRFHVDRVPCRLVTTYRGKATHWLPHHLANRSKLGAGNQGQTDDKSGLFATTNDIQRLERGHVALLKGTLWEGNENAGLVHRSAPATSSTRRLLFTLDFVRD